MITLPHRRPVSASAASKVLDPDDVLTHWKKPARTQRSSYSQQDWEGLPETLLLG